MVYNFPQTNIRLCLKWKNIPEYLIDIIINNYNNSYYIHKVLEESRKYHKRRLKSEDNYALNFQIGLFHSEFIKFYGEYDYEHNGDIFRVLDKIKPENIINLKIRTTNLLMNWTKDKKELSKIKENDGNIYICAGQARGHWFTTIQEQQAQLVNCFGIFKSIQENCLFYGNEHMYTINPCVKCVLYENNIIDISIRNY